MMKKINENPKKSCEKIEEQNFQKKNNKFRNLAKTRESYLGRNRLEGMFMLVCYFKCRNSQENVSTA